MKFKGTKGTWDSLGLSVWCGNAGKYICKIYTDETNDIDEANAKLIAASPEMLELLQEYHDMAIKIVMPTEQDLNELAEKSQLLIHKAIG